MLTNLLPCQDLLKNVVIQSLKFHAICLSFKLTARPQINVFISSAARETFEHLLVEK